MGGQTDAKGRGVWLPQDPVPAELVEDVTLTALKSAQLDDVQVGRLVDAVVRLNDSGFRPFKVVPKGLLAVDSVAVQSVVAPDQADAVNATLTAERVVEEIRSLSIGLPRAELFLYEAYLR